MIQSLRSKALKDFWLKGQSAGIKPEWVKRVTLILSVMDASDQPSGLDLPGLAFHALKGNLRGRFAVTVGGNWRITFGWNGTNAINVDLEDYHGK